MFFNKCTGARVLRLFSIIGISIVLFYVAGCSSVLSGMTANISYAPPASPNDTKQNLHMHVADERRTNTIVRNLGFASPILGYVNITIVRPHEETHTLVSPLQAAQIALTARIDSVKYSVLSGKNPRDDAREFILYLYDFSADFSAEYFCVANVTLALGEIPASTDTKGKNLTPDKAKLTGNSIHTPICSQSSGMGTAKVFSNNHKAAAEIALSQALAQAVEALNLEVCLK